VRWPLIGLLHYPLMVDGDDCEAIVGMNYWQGKLKYSLKTCHSATRVTTDPTLGLPWSPKRATVLCRIRFVLHIVDKIGMLLSVVRLT
jgi:hypothetical protein